MGIINRDLDKSEKLKDVNVGPFATATGATFPLCVIPYACKIAAFVEAAQGLSGAPVHSLHVLRFNTAGATVIEGLFATQTVQSQGTSGPIGFSLTSYGNTMVFQANDLLFLGCGASNAAVAKETVLVVLEAVADIKKVMSL